MKSESLLGRHLAARDALDYLEHLLSPRRVAEVEAHLAMPCPDCRERLRALAQLTTRMRADRAEAVPEALHRRALEQFVPRPAAAPFGARVLAAARLLFDSWAQPLPAAVRRAVGEARRLRWELAEGTLEIELEPGADGTQILRGRLQAPEPALVRIEVRALSETFSAWPDASGAFAFERLPAADLELAVVGPDRVERVPTVRP